MTQRQDLLWVPERWEPKNESLSLLDPSTAASPRRHASPPPPDARAPPPLMSSKASHHRRWISAVSSTEPSQWRSSPAAPTVEGGVRWPDRRSSLAELAGGRPRWPEELAVGAAC